MEQCEPNARQATSRQDMVSTSGASTLLLTTAQKRIGIHSNSNCLHGALTWAALAQAEQPRASNCRAKTYLKALDQCLFEIYRKIIESERVLNARRWSSNSIDAINSVTDQKRPGKLREI